MNPERGFGWLKLIAGLLVFALIIYVGYKIISGLKSVGAGVSKAVGAVAGVGKAIYEGGAEIIKPVAEFMQDPAEGGAVTGGGSRSWRHTGYTSEDYRWNTEDKELTWLEKLKRFVTIDHSKVEQ